MLLMLLMLLDRDVVDVVDSKFPELFNGLEKLQGEYDIKLSDSVTPFALTTPRHIPIPQA